MSTNPFFDYPTQDDDQDYRMFIFLPEWDDSRWGKLLEHTQMHVYDPGETVIDAGSAEQTLHIVAFGSLEVRVKVMGRNRVIATIQAGSVIGEQSFFDGKPRSASVFAVSPCQILELSRDNFDIFSARHPKLARDLLFDLGRILSLRLRQFSTNALQQGL